MDEIQLGANLMAAETLNPPFQSINYLELLILEAKMILVTTAVSFSVPDLEQHKNIIRHHAQLIHINRCFQ